VIDRKSITSFFCIVAGFPVGAAGLAQAVLAGAATTSTLAAITGAAYATNARLQASAEVAANLASAQKVMNYKNWTNFKFILVSGYSIMRIETLVCNGQWLFRLWIEVRK